MNFTEDSLCLNSLPQARGCAWICCLKSKVGRVRTVSHRLFPVLYSVTEQLVLAVPATLARALSVSAWHLCSGLQRGRELRAPGYRPVTVWGSCSVRLLSPLLGLGKSRVPWVSRTASSDAGLEAHESQPRQTPRNLLGQSRGRVSDPSPRHEYA